jgi:hypothetical protein
MCRCGCDTYWLEEIDKGNHYLVLKRCSTCNCVLDSWTRLK